MTNEEYVPIKQLPRGVTDLSVKGGAVKENWLIL